MKIMSTVGVVAISIYEIIKLIKYVSVLLHFEMRSIVRAGPMSFSGQKNKGSLPEQLPLSIQAGVCCLNLQTLPRIEYMLP